MFRNFYTMIVNIPKKSHVEMFKPLHRWSLDYCHDNMNRKIDLANEDHCGPCGQYSLKKLNENNIYENSIYIDKVKDNEFKYKYSPFRSSHIDYLIYYENKD